MTQRFCWIRLKESNFFFCEYDSKNRPFQKYVLRIVLKYDSQNWTYFSALSIEWNIWEYDSKNWSFIAIKHDTKNWTSFWCDPGVEPLSDMTQKIELFVIWPQGLNFSDVTQRIEHFLNVSQRIEPFINMTQRIEPSIWLKELNPLHKRTQRIGP